VHLYACEGTRRNCEDIANEPYSWRAEVLNKMSQAQKATIVTDTKSGEIVACNSAWNKLCGYSPEEAFSHTPIILQGKLTSQTKARQYAMDVLSSKTYAKDHGFAGRQAITRTKLVNYTKSGRPFVHCLQSKRVMDEDSGKEYFITESHEETDENINQVMLQGMEQPVEHPLRDGFLFVSLVSTFLAPSMTLVIRAALNEVIVEG